jgi:hypothetical protein
MDLVGTVPKTFWEEWLAEGNCAGEQERTDLEYAWFTKSKVSLKILPGDRLYIVCNGKLRGWAPVIRLLSDLDDRERPYFAICRSGGAVACTIPQAIPGFRGLRKRWWEHDQEIPFPDWKEL